MLLVVVLAFAQVFRTVTGVVVDAQGAPVAKASIDHLGSQQSAYTDALGRFAVKTTGRAIVIRKEGFDGHFLRTNANPAGAVVLQRASRLLPPCSTECETLGGYSQAFCFPRLEGIRLSALIRDIDYAMRFYSTPGRGEVIRHGAGPLWSHGMPSNGDIWESLEYEERRYGLIIDARGTAISGTRWRYLGRVGESASYHRMKAEQAALLDKVLDGVCVKQDP